MKENEELVRISVSLQNTGGVETFIIERDCENNLDIKVSGEFSHRTQHLLDTLWTTLAYDITTFKEEILSTVTK